MDEKDQIQLREVPATLARSWLFESAAADAFGGAEDFQQSIGNEMTFQIGDRPVSRSLRKLYGLGGRKFPADLAALKGEVFLISHAVGTFAAKDANRIVMIGYQASFDDDGSTIDLFPNTRFQEFFAANARFEAGISADGSARLPDQVGDLIGDIIPIGGSGELHLSADASVIGKLSLTIKTPKIQAVGQSSSTCIWQFDKDQQPLVGDQVMVQTVVVPKGQESLTFKIQGFSSVDPGFFRRPARFETAVFTVQVDLR